MEGVFGHLVFGMRRKEKARKEKKPVDWAYPISFAHVSMDSRIMPDISPGTIEATLIRLQKEGKIRKIGTYKNARYIKN